MFIIDPAPKQLEFNINCDFFKSCAKRTLKPKFDANWVDYAGRLFIDFCTRK
jgi:hypothetical protein